MCQMEIPNQIGCTFEVDQFSVWMDKFAIRTLFVVFINHVNCHVIVLHKCYFQSVRCCCGRNARGRGSEWWSRTLKSLSVYSVDEETVWKCTADYFSLIRWWLSMGGHTKSGTPDSVTSHECNDPVRVARPGCWMSHMHLGLHLLLSSASVDKREVGQIVDANWSTRIIK